MTVAVVELERDNQRRTIVVAAQDAPILNELIREYAERHELTVIDVVDCEVGLGSIVYESHSITCDGKGRDTQFN